MQILKTFPNKIIKHILWLTEHLWLRMVQINPMRFNTRHISHIALQAHGEIGDVVQNTQLAQQAQLILKDLSFI